MEHVFVTVRYGTNQEKDLMLPYEVPSQLLADVLAQALHLSSTPNALWHLALEMNGQRKKIPPALVLAESSPRIFCGSTIYLEAETSPGYLLAENGSKFMLKAGTNTLGRGGPSVVNIDLSPLDQADSPITSRVHAEIVYEADNFYLRDRQSVNGTFVNGQELRPREQFRLDNGDVIELGPREHNGVRLTFYWNN